MSFLDDDAIARLGREVTAKVTTDLQASFDVFQAQHSGKPVCEVASALREYLAGTPFAMDSQAIMNTAEAISRGLNVKWSPGG
jgi:hypothetical protein